MRRVLVPVTLSDVPAGGVDAGRIAVLAGSTMGTSWSVRLVASPDLPMRDVRRGIDARLDRIVAQMSTWEPDSDVSRFNRAPAETWHVLPEDCFTVLEFALGVARDTGGAYDPTVGPLVNLWGFGPTPRRTRRPSADAIATARARSGWARVTLDAELGRARQPGGTYVDLSSVAKGFAVDRVADFLRHFGVASYLVEIGGELRGRGMKPDGSPWWVAVERPPVASEERAAGPDLIVALHELAIATSGDYRRYFEHSGVRYSHTIDPRSGAPIAHRLASVTVLHQECMVADALATALLVLGPEVGMDYARRLDLAALFVERADQGFEEHLTRSLAAMLE